jgi:hypothetical protein
MSTVGRPKGLPRTGGRKPGTPNKNSQQVLDRVRMLGKDPLEILVLFYLEDWKALGYEARTVTRYTQTGAEYEEFVIPPELRASCAKDVMKYCFPQRKAVEYNAVNENENHTPTNVAPEQEERLLKIARGEN